MVQSHSHNRWVFRRLWNAAWVFVIGHSGQSLVAELEKALKL